MWWWPVVAVVGFAAATALVIALARSDTARWERDHRAVPTTVRQREEANRRLRAAALLARRPPPSGRLAQLHLPSLHLPHPHVRPVRLPRPHVHLPHLHLPHVHLPAGVVARLPHVHRRPVPPGSGPEAQDPGTPAGVQEPDEHPTGTPS